LYGIKFQGTVTPLVLAIREEIFNEPYDSIDFASHRNNIHKLDLYHPHHPVGTIANYAARCLEYCSGVLGVVRKKALDYVYKLIVYEDENTGYQCIAPISKSLDMICRYVVEGPDSTAISQHVSKIDDFLWMSSEGMMVTGTNGSQLWDLAFISQAIVESGLAEEEGNRESCLRALDWLERSQIRDDPTWYEMAYRHGSKGAWPFSTPEQSYTVSRSEQTRGRSAPADSELCVTTGVGLHR
jgi:lanosterol synthase